MPVPLSVSVPLFVNDCPFKSSTAPDVTKTPPAPVVGPSAAALLALSVPAEIVVLPVYVLPPLSMTAPEPVLVKPFPPEMIPERVSCVPATENVLPLAPNEIAPLSELVPVEVAKVPPLMVTASSKTTTPCKSSVAPLAIVVPPAVVPRPVAFVMARVPAETIVVPV